MSGRDGFRYILRESRWEKDCWRHRDLVDLGSDPGCFIQYPGGNGFYFSAELEEILQNKGVQYSADELEEVFLPFLKPGIRRIIENFRRRQNSGKRWSRCSRSELLDLQKDLHAFDKRRLHYLRCGRVDIGTLDGRPWKFLNVLLGKSRDEIEQTIASMEQQLRPQEFKPYIYTALHLQRYFADHITRNEPAALNVEKVDDVFLSELCRLNGDAGFFRGVGRVNWRKLHPYLVRYVIRYFDNDFERPSIWSNYAREFEWRRQFHPGGGQRRGMAAEEACKCLGICPTEFEKMNRNELTRYYRRQAKKLHPDSGGNHDEFIRMTEAYESLLVEKGNQ